MSDKEGSLENIVGELRSALGQLSIPKPYVLMPHSVSGIYSLYYANTYPDEIAGVVGLDITLPKAVEYFNESAPTFPEFLKYVASTGITRLAANLAPSQTLPISEEGTYSNSNLKMTKAITSWGAYNKTVVNEANHIQSNIDKIKDMQFSEELPVLYITTTEDKKTADGKSNVTFFETQITDELKKLVTLEGHHYLHWTKSKEISKEVDEFINER